MDKPLSAREQQVLAYVVAFINNNGGSPTVREVRRGCGLSSTSVAAYALDRLDDKGYIKRPVGIARGIKLLNVPGETIVVAFTGADAELVRRAYGDAPRRGIINAIRRRYDRAQKLGVA